MPDLAGTMWKLVETAARDAEGHDVPSPFGAHPMGFLMFTENRILVAVTDAQPPGPAGTAASALISYTGTYRFDGQEFITTTEAASRPDLLVEQVRHLHFDGDTRLVVTPKNNLLGRPVGLTLVWERVA